ncbi:MAG TPA: hypothetical protein VH120_12370, partial [Gemmataceae bacterium]|nr:hypothetical protein [Gemmataceae bacterium]
MAFNPFHAFRKHSKVVFAGLTILCMVTFILSSGMGRGDFFSQMTDWFTGRVGRTTYVSLYGKNYTGREVDEVNYQRRMANEYMDLAISLARQALEIRLMKESDQLSQEARRQIQEPLFSRMILFQMREVSPQVRAQEIRRLHLNTTVQLQQADADKKTELANALGTLRRLLELDYTLVGSRRPDERFFGWTINDRIDDTVNFLVWRHQADQLGVRLADGDVGQMILDETRGELTKESAETIDKAMREKFRNGYSVESLYASLREEFRVRIAQLALTGTASGVGQYTLTAPPVELTPQESWTLFQDARTTVRIGMIDV